MDLRLSTYEELESTNLEVKRAIEAGEPEGFAVRALRQTGGYGRQGRTWVSPDGGLYLSLLLRPNVSVEKLPTLSLVAGLAVREAVAALVGETCADQVKLKWPNDVVFDAELFELDAVASEGSGLLKIAGISLELHRGAVCLGVGVNVARPRQQIAVEGKNRPAYLGDLGYEGAAEEAADVFLRIFAMRYAAWLSDGFESMLEPYNEHSYLLGRTVRVCDMAGKVLAAGAVKGSDSQGRLLVDDGTCVVPVFSGEAHVL